MICRQTKSALFITDSNNGYERLIARPTYSGLLRRFPEVKLCIALKGPQHRGRVPPTLGYFFPVEMKRGNPVDIFILPAFLTFFLDIDHIQLKFMLYASRWIHHAMQW